MMKKRIKLLSIIVVFVFLLTIPNNYVAANTSLTIDNSEKISNDLKEILKTKNDDELIPVDIWFEDTIDKEVENDVKSIIGINKATLTEKGIKNHTISENKQMISLEKEKVNKYIQTERKISKEKQIIKHNDFLNNVKKDKCFQHIESKVTFKSKYAPLISMKLNKNEISNMAKASNVLNINYKHEYDYGDECNISIPLLRVPYTRDNLGLTGSGIKVGQIESGMPALSNANITYDPNVTYYNSNHANVVASVMLEIAPDIKLYSTRLTGNWRERVEWLLDQGVNVINMSAHVSSGNGTYTSDDQWIDHLAINHSVHFVKSAGNTSGYISTPGMGYNVITVGAIDDKNTSNKNDDTIANYSSRNEASSGVTNKPDLVAPGSNILTSANGGYDSNGPSGTSFATPHVTGIIAQLLELRPSLTTKQDAIKAILTASISHDILNFEFGDSGYDIYGAGVVDSQASRYTIAHNRYVNSYFSANSMILTYHEYNFNVSSSDEKIRVSLAWLRHSYISSSNHEDDNPIIGRFADLTLTVYDPNRNVVASSMSNHNNVEIVDFVPTVSGQYTIRVTQVTNSNKKIYYGVAWW